tara:strand:- start:643 stop:900 length:258 start_codon:yes stop_codon:yes gene_type:complete
MKHFDELLVEGGYRAPAPICKPVYEDINVMIRKAKEGLADAEWNDKEYPLLFNKRTWLQFLLAEKRRGMERFLIGIEQTKEITKR